MSRILIPRRSLALPRRHRQAQGGFIMTPYGFAPAGGGSLHDLILADSPVMYLRLGETTGTVAENETGGTDGSYSGVTLDQTPLYTGGPRSVRTAGSSNKILWPSASVPATMDQMTLGVIMSAAAISGLRQILSRAQSGAYWQWRLNGANMELYKTTSGTQSCIAAHGMSAATAYLLMVTVTNAGAVKLFVNGASIGSASITGVNYGGEGGGVRDVSIGSRSGVNDATDNYFSEAFIIPTALSDARVLQYAEAAAFA